MTFLTLPDRILDRLAYLGWDAREPTQRPRVKEARTLFALVANQLGYSQVQISEWLKVDRTNVGRYLRDSTPAQHQVAGFVLAWLREHEEPGSIVHAVGDAGC